MRTDNRRVLGELASSMAGLSTEMTVMRGDIAGLRAAMEAILAELRDARVQNASLPTCCAASKSRADTARTSRHN